MTKTIVILATMDTKGAESAHMRDEIIRLGGTPLLMDIGVVADPDLPVDISADKVAQAGGSSLETLRIDPSREVASEVMVKGATALMLDLISNGKVDAVLSLGGTQGTANVTQVMQALPYGYPKIMVSTMASSDTSGYVGIKDITMMFSVSDILGLNPLCRAILTNAAGAAVGMANASKPIAFTPGKPVIGITNLGVLTQGAMHAMDRFAEHGFETIVFHAVGSGGEAMEQLMREGIIQAVFDYAMGDIVDALFGGIRSAEPGRLTVASKLGLPQVVIPGGTDHIGVMLDVPNSVPDVYKDRKYTFHNPVILVPRTSGEEVETIAADIARRLDGGNDYTTMMLPLGGVSSYSIDGGALEDHESDARLFAALHATISNPIIEVDATAESPEFVDRAVDELLRLIALKQES
jgi:uncharacterized protein (UPF0261 family)